MVRYDAVIIGAGHNGLVAANYLAMHGLRVLVVERRGVVGGLAASEEVWPGFRVPTGAYVISLFKPRLIRELGLDKMGLRIFTKEPGLFVPFPNGRSITIWPDEGRTVKEIERYSTNDARNYPRWNSFWDAFSTLIDQVLFSPPPNLLDLIEEARRLAPLIGVMRGRLEAFLEELAYAMTTSAGRMLSDYFESEELKAALVEDGVVGSFAGPYTPGTAYVLAHHVMGEVNGVKGAWGYVEGGIGRLSELLMERARRLGVDFILGIGVRRILVKDGAVVGVELGDGRIIESGVVLSNADIKTTFLRLLDPDAVDKWLRRRIENLKSVGVSAKIVGILNGLPKYNVNDADPMIGHRASALIMPSVDYVERAYRDALNGSFSREPWVSINIPTVYDKTITTSDKHVFSMFIQYAPRFLNWDEELKARFRDTVYEVVEQYIPGFRRFVEKDLVLTPLDYEVEYGTMGGNIFHIDISLDQLFMNRPLPEMHDYTTPIRGLYLCGSDAHPGGGVMGAPGYNAAHRVLQDLGMIKERPRLNLVELLNMVVKVLRWSPAPPK
ncbi:phytoene desaturase family protein [Vulcanisaeta thermophila]|uniref:phytoene desaturase family protein n=1 Tax=Vulcanisaeta thermophila TaxID=867917 RepID=UPI00085377CF|nr:NAD(P)/FAD-dependent oxidoreductase [Vulcanisaeta thermophila]